MEGGDSVTKSCEILKEWILESKHIVFFGGAGVSTESGIPDFRSQDGLYHQRYDVPPEQILSHNYYMTHPKEFYDFYRDKMLYLDAKPNSAHKKLAQWEQEGKLLAVVTQNIDGLHQAAGSQKVYELHGSVHRNRCLSCGRIYSAEWIAKSQGIPQCSCGGKIKPDVVLYEEALNPRTIQGAVEAIQQADLLMVAGTSLAVYPAAGLIDYYSGDRLVLINGSPTPYDRQANLLISGKVGEILAQMP